MGPVKNLVRNCYAAHACTEDPEVVEELVQSACSYDGTLPVRFWRALDPRYAGTWDNILNTQSKIVINLSTCVCVPVRVFQLVCACDQIFLWSIAIVLPCDKPMQFNPVPRCALCTRVRGAPLSTTQHTVTGNLVSHGTQHTVHKAECTTHVVALR